MTASKRWAVIVGILVVGLGLVGAVLWNRRHPDAIDVAAVTGLVTPKTTTPETTPPVAATKVPQTAKLELPKLESVQPRPDAGHDAAPHFDVVRVEPTGEAVVAGKGDPNAEVALVEGGKVVAETKADPGGNFVILPPPLAPGNHDLTLRQSADGRTPTDSTQAVAVAVPTKKGAPVVVALAEPGKPTRLISGPPQASTTPSPTVATAPAPAHAPEATAAKPPEVATASPQTAIAPPRAIAPNGPGLAIRSVELENGNGFYATGIATPGTHVEIYLNDVHVAAVAAGADGQWSLTIKKGLTGGHYTVRADALGAGGKVIARAEVPFDVPVAMAEAAPAAAPSKPVSPAGADAAPEPPSAPDPSEVAGLGRQPDQPAGADTAPEPPSAPNPSEVSGLGPQTPSSVEIPTQRPDIAAAAKAAAAAAAPASQTAVAPPTKTAQAPRAATPDNAAAPAPTANAVIDEVETALVTRGDNLWNISRTRLGQGHRYTQIYAANVSQIRDPKLIYPGQVFVVPPK